MRMRVCCMFQNLDSNTRRFMVERLTFESLKKKWSRVFFGLSYWKAKGHFKALCTPGKIQCPLVQPNAYLHRSSCHHSQIPPCTRLSLLVVQASEASWPGGWGCDSGVRRRWLESSLHFLLIMWSGACLSLSQFPHLSKDDSTSIRECWERSW